MQIDWWQGSDLLCFLWGALPASHRVGRVRLLWISLMNIVWTDFHFPSRLHHEKWVRVSRSRSGRGEGWRGIKAPAFMAEEREMEVGGAPRQSSLSWLYLFTSCMSHHRVHQAFIILTTRAFSTVCQESPGNGRLLVTNDCFSFLKSQPAPTGSSGQAFL